MQYGPILMGMREISRVGSWHTLGQTIDGKPAVWANVGGQPIAVFPAGEWVAANQWFDAAEHGQQVGRANSQRNRNTLIIVFSVLAIVLAGAYVAIHSHRYSHCIVQPGLFDWPSTCL